MKNFNHLISREENGLFLAVFLLIFFCSLTSFSQNNKCPLQVNIIPEILHQRSFAPLPVTVQFNWNGTEIVTGRLEIIYTVHGSQMQKMVSEEVTLSTGILNRAMLLLPDPTIYNNTADLRLRFITNNNTVYDLQPQTLPLAKEFGCYNFNICFIESLLAKSRRVNIASALRLEELAPLGKASGNRKKRNTGVTFLPLERLPKTLFGYCAFDIVVLPGESLSNMSKKQLDVLSRWIFSGGVLCLIPGGAGFSSSHVEFINKLLAKNLKGNTDMFLSDANGKLIYPSDFPENKIGMYYSGLGRLAIIGREIDSEECFKELWWRNVCAFLWRVRSDRINSVTTDGKWFTEKEMEKRAAYAKKNYMYDSYISNFDEISGHSNRNFSIQSIIFENIKFFLPRKFRVLPVWLISLILFSFILIVGPVDYWGLGKLRMRKFTWLTFPVVCVIFTVITVTLANRYMGTTDHRSSMTIIDEGHNGEILRRIEYEVIFQGSNKNTVRPYSQSFFSQCDRGYYHYGRSGYNTSNQLSTSGRLFSDYNVFQYFRKWTPRLNRIVGFQGNKEDGHPWAFPAEYSEMSMKKFARTIKGYCKKNHLLMDIRLISSDGTEGVEEIYTSNMPYLPNRIRERTIRLTDIRERDAGLFAILSGISPSFGHDGDELMLGDCSDKKQKIVVVSVFDPVKRRLKIYRRLYIEDKGQMTDKK